MIIQAFVYKELTTKQFIITHEQNRVAGEISTPENRIIITIMKKFNPLTFLAALGAGGIAVAPFVFFQYSIPHGKGLITFDQLMSVAEGSGQAGFYYLLQAIMVVFGVLHLGLTAKLLTDLFAWRKTADYKSFIADPQRNTAVLAAFTSLGMTFNVFIGVIRFFVPAMSGNFQALMLPALIAWAILWILLMRTEMTVLKSSFQRDFDISKASFGWLLHPFALGMVSVAGSGLAAMAKDPTIAHISAFMTLTSASMGAFLLLVKLVSIFKSHFTMSGMPERQFLPSFLIVVPITTIYSIILFRMGHYLEHQFGWHFEAYYLLVILIPFAFQTWYLAFGMAMLKDYFKKDFFRKEYYVSLWAFICPFVGYSVLGNFLNKFFVPNIVTQSVVFVSLLLAVAFYAFVAIRFFKYEYSAKSKLAMG